jgi:hypothetical protein
MAFAPGQFITAQRLNRLQPKIDQAICSAAVTGTATNTDITGTNIAFDTETDGAQLRASWTVDARNTAGGGGTQIAVHAYLDTSILSDDFALFQGSAASERGGVSASWDTTVTTAGSHSIKLRVTQSTNNQVNVYTQLSIMVLEIV